jgi:hypothetical protein
MPVITDMDILILPSLDSIEDCITYLEEKGLSNAVATMICETYFPPNVMPETPDEMTLVYFDEHRDRDMWPQYLDQFYERFNILSTFGKESPDGENTIPTYTIVQFITNELVPETTSNANFHEFIKKANLFKSIGINPVEALDHAYFYYELSLYYDKEIIEFFFQNFIMKVQSSDFSSFYSINSIIEKIISKKFSISVATEICEKAAVFISIGIKIDTALYSAYKYCKRNSDSRYVKADLEAYFQNLTLGVQFLLSLPPVENRILFYL